FLGGTELIEEDLQHFFLTWIPRDADATHVAVNVVRLVTIAEFHLIELAVGVHVQWDACDAARVLVGLVIHVI
ncbi:MAG: hypothetical protein ACKPKO_19770, partial [Candidatus Fonsibacter sp.]